jgi:signal transduction histidine kinase
MGYAARVRRQYLEAVEARLAAAEHDREETARRLLAEERARLARELHDVVAHHVSLIGVQAGAARLSLGGPTENTANALAAIEQSSRSAVGEMRHLLEALRDGAAGNEPHPQPGLHQLHDLLGRWRAAGYQLDTNTTAVDLDGLAPTLSLSCYRIVEESLTNVARHSQARRVHVVVAVSSSDVRIAVADPGPPVTVGPGDGGGRGLLGIAERAALFGGVARCGPQPGGGFAVEAVLPRSEVPSR